MRDESTEGGTDNPAFIHDEDTSSVGRDSESAACNSSGDEKTINGHGNHSFVSKHYVEPRQSPEPHFKTETRIEVPDDSTAQEKPKQNGHHGNGNNNDVSFLNTTVTSVSNNDVTDKKEQIEAVNLELVSMKPYSGSNNHQAKNQEACEVPADPYEEYFVPVNEHRKFIRGEKLYVTKDKRSTKSYWKKIVCWACSFLIVAVIAIIAILAGTGVILTQEDTQSLANSGKISSRQFNDAQPAGSQEYIKNPPSSPPPATSTSPIWPTTDESLYRHVPKALDGVIKLDDLDWNDDMNNSKSRVYREVVDDLEKSLVTMLSLNEVMPIVKVHSISKDGEVKFRVSQPVFEKPEDNQNHLENQFRQNGSAIGRYHVNRIQISSLVNHCYSGDMGCSESCVYDYLETIFICMCPTGKMFDTGSKKCVDNPELTRAHFGATGSEEFRGRSRMPDDMYHPESQDWKDSRYDLHDHHHRDSQEQTSPEPTSKSEHSVELFSKPHVVTESESEREPVAEPESEPEPSSEPASESKVESEPTSEPKSEPQPSAEPKAEPEPTSEPKSKSEPSSEPQSVAEPKLETEPIVEPEPSSEPQPAAEPNAEPEPDSEPKSESEPSSEPQPVAEPNAEPEPDNEAKSVPEPSSESQPVAEPNAEPEPDSEPKSESEPSSEPQSVAEPNAVPELDSEPKSEPEPSSEPQSTVEPKSELKPISEPKSEPEPSSEPQPAAETEFSSEPVVEPKSEPETVVEPEPSSEPQPAAEPKAELNPGSEPEPVSDFNHKPEVTVEPKSEPEPSSEPQSGTESIAESAPTQDSKTEPQSFIESQETYEPKVEPEPSVDPKTESESIGESNGDVTPSEESSTMINPKSEWSFTTELKRNPEIVQSEPKKEDESLEKLKNELEGESNGKPIMTSSTPSTIIDSTLLPFEDINESKTVIKQKESSNASLRSKQINEDLEKKIDNLSSKHDKSFDSAAVTFFLDSETTTVPSEPAVIIGLNEVTTQVNRENANESLNIKKGPHLDKDEPDFSDQIEGVVSASDKNEQKNNTNRDNDSFTRNINSNSNVTNPETHEKDLSEKNEESPEEQYNDIRDNLVPKSFEKNDIEISSEERKIQKIYKENKNINYTKSKSDSDLATKLASKTTTPSIVEATEKRLEDSTMTSQVPILPIEIQLEMLTTENAEKADPQTISLEAEKETTSTTILPKTANTEGKTTEQIPILPEELQTTMMNKQEHHTEPPISIEMDKKPDRLVVANHKKEEVKEEKSLKSNENNSSVESTSLKESVDEDSIEKTTVYNTSSEKSESPVKDVIKPVFESISDDTTPQTFEFKYLLTTTTEKTELPNDFEDNTEEPLRVIPLGGTYRSLQKPDEPTNVKKEKELSFDTPDGPDNADRKSSRTVDDDNIPKLISGSSSNVDPDEGLKTIYFSPDFNSMEPKPVIPLGGIPINYTDAAKYPNFIPVSEETDENDYRFTESPYSSFNNRRDSVTNLPELHSGEVIRNKSVEHHVNETATELLQAVESSTNKTLLVENLPTKNDSDISDKNVEQTATEKNKIIVTSTSESTSPQFTGIPVAIVTTEQDASQQIFFSKCKSGQFQCVNGTSRDGSYCVDLSSTCDSENDCSDGSDEFDCEKEGCPGNFQCASGQCLKRHLVCNGIADCDDSSDEKDCSNWKCHFDEFQCPNGRCIPVLWQCDGRPDCENHVDEYSCSESCGNDEYLCPTEKWCIPQTWRCNGVPECVNGEDEKLCECAVDQFKCETGGCVSAEQLCDGVENCPDRSDEWNCLSGFSKNSSIATEVDKENKENEFSTKSSPIKIRQSNGEQSYICSDGWTDAFSDQYCRSLGFAASESTQFTETGTDKKLLQLAANANPKSSIVLNLKKMDSCDSKKIVEVSCQEFSCGSHESVGPTARLVGGTPATEGQWSSVALLKEPEYGTSCTASIISPMHALASYSCIYSNRQSGGWQLFVGGNLLKPNKVKNIVPYPQVKYNQFLYNNDIALVELAEPLVFSRNISAACLPNQSFQPPQLCVTVGWGFPVNGEIDLQQYLKFLPVPTYNSEECNATSHYAGFITKNNICAGFTDTDKGPCYNDEGAPLMCVSETGRWEIQGLLSHHSRCSRGHPAIYSSLAPALSWLRNSVPALQAHS